MTTRHLAAVAFFFAVALACACSVDVDLTNKQCPCGDGYVCDTAKNLCITPALAALTPKTCADPCPCTGDVDCTDKARPSCSATSKTCVECNPAADKCPAGSYCNEKSQCAVGCRESADCSKISPASPLCARARHQCVECLGASDCKGKTCSPSGKCVDGCSGGQACPTGRECCDGLCLDLKADTLNCGRCKAECSTQNGSPRCEGGACAWDCASGFAHCGTENSGCETNTRNDPAHCGSCTTSCTGLQNVAGATCAAGACSFTACSVDFGDCDGDRTNGCECTCGNRNERCCPNSVCYHDLGCNGGNQCK